MKKQFKIEFGFGIGVTSDGRPLTAADVTHGLSVIRAEAARVFGGYTVLDSVGGWTNGYTGELVEEAGKVLFTVQPEVDRVRVENFAAFIRGALEQEAVAVTITEVFFSCLSVASKLFQI